MNFSTFFTQPLFMRPDVAQFQFSEWFRPGFAGVHPGLKLMAAEHKAESWGEMLQKLADEEYGLKMLPGQIGLMQVSGTICAGASAADELFWGVYNLDRVHENLQSAREQGAQALVIAYDSPGGVASGVADAAEAIQAADWEDFPVYSWVRSAYSAAYWLAAAAQIAGAPSAGVGSIGTYIAIPDLTKMWEKMGVEWTFLRDGKYKGMGHPGKPVTQDEIAFLQARLEEVGGEFKGFVRSQRPKVTEEMMQGQTFEAKAAPALVDETKYRSLEGLLADLRQHLTAA